MHLHFTNLKSIALVSFSPYLEVRTDPRDANGGQEDRRSSLNSGVNIQTVLLSPVLDVHVSSDGPGQRKG